MPAGAVSGGWIGAGTGHGCLFGPILRLVTVSIASRTTALPRVRIPFGPIRVVVDLVARHVVLTIDGLMIGVGFSLQVLIHRINYPYV